MTRSAHELTVNGAPRHLILHTPEARTERPYPAMLVLHGSTVDADDNADLNYPAHRFEGHYDEAVFAPMRREHGFVMVYLSARLSSGWFCWENGNGEVGLCALPSNGNDEAFVRAALDLMGSAVGGIDTERMFVFGMSGGASMAWKLGCHAPSVAAINASLHVGAVAGTLAPSLQTCCCAAPSVVAIHGDADSYVDVQTADATADWFGAAHGCDDAVAAPIDDVHAADDGDVELHVYSGCHQSRLEYYRVAGGGHTLPGAPMVWAGLGSTSTFDAASAVWRSWHNGQTTLAASAADGDADDGECALGELGACELGAYTWLIVACAVVLVCAASACVVMGRESRASRSREERGGRGESQTGRGTAAAAQEGRAVVGVAALTAVDAAAAPARSRQTIASHQSISPSRHQAAPDAVALDPPQQQQGERASSRRPTPTPTGEHTAPEPRAAAQLWLSDAVADGKEADGLSWPAAPVPAPLPSPVTEVSAGARESGAARSTTDCMAETDI